MPAAAKNGRDMLYWSMLLPLCGTEDKDKTILRLLESVYIFTYRP